MTKVELETKERSKGGRQSAVDAIVILTDFVKALEDNGYAICKKNRKHVPGEGYSGPPYYKCDSEKVVSELMEE